MNKKTVMIASGATGLILTLGACGTETYEYQVSGIVETQQVDYECPGVDIAMDAVAFEAKPVPKKKPDGNSANDSEVKAKPTPKPSSSTTKPSSGSSKKGTPTAKSSPTASASKTGKTSKKPSNKGVKLNKKPEKPEKVKNGKVPKLKYTFKPKGCEAEYEIFVTDGSGNLYEQDVRKVDYDRCAQLRVKTKLFPGCTTS